MNRARPAAGEARNEEGLLRRLLAVRTDERTLVLLAAAYFFFVLASYYVLRPIRDEIGAIGGGERLPWLFLGTLGATLALTPLFGTLVARLPRARVATWSYRLLSACLVGFFALLRDPATAPAWAAPVFFVWVSVFNLFAVSLFWSVMTDAFRAEQARRLFGMIAAGGTLGGLAGGLLTGWLVGLLGAAPLLLVSGVLLECALRCMRALTARAAATAGEQARIERAPVGGGALAGLAHVVRSPYLAGIALFIALFTIGSTFLYYLQAQIVAAAFTDRAARIAYFANVDAAVNAATLLLQLFVTGRLFARIGTTAMLALLPLASIAGFAALAAFPVVAVLVAFQVARRTLDFALMRPAREALYVPLAREDKYKTKNVIDTFVYRGGDQLGIWAQGALVAFGLGVPGIACVGVLLAAAWLALAVWLGRTHARLQGEPGAPPRPSTAPSDQPLGETSCQ
jgi:AAA family ATP:ADP antiporter